jgi:hypothetical protein
VFLRSAWATAHPYLAIVSLYFWVRPCKIRGLEHVRNHFPHRRKLIQVSGELQLQFIGPQGPGTSRRSPPPVSFGIDEV